MTGTRANLLDTVSADPILAPFADGLRALARSSIVLTVDRAAPRSLRESRIGGWPAMPADLAWPRRAVAMPQPSPGWLENRFGSSTIQTRRLPSDGLSIFQFIAQIDLAAVAPYDQDGLLPRAGLLLFFYDDSYESDVPPDTAGRAAAIERRTDGRTFRVEHFGWDPVDQVRVMLVGTDDALVPRVDGPHAAYAEPLAAAQEWTVPSVDAYAIASEDDPRDERNGRVLLTGDARARLAELEYEARANVDIVQMLGWADNFSHGPSLPPDVDDIRSLPVEDRLGVTQDVRLLLQVPAGVLRPTGFDVGRDLYFYIRDRDLRRRDFSRAWYDMDS